MSRSNGFNAHRRTVLYLTKLLFFALSNLPSSWAAPLRSSSYVKAQEGGVDPKEPDDPEIWLDLAISTVLVLLGGIFAGLTIALMGQDEINLQVIAKSGKGAEKKHAGRVLRLLTRGKHWVLVTLLLSNVITNETLPIVLDRSLGGGWPAVLGSTIAIVIFGEIIPQSVCVRFGLAIGAWMSPFVLVLMYIESPVAWPTAKLLDKLIGEEHGTTYSKSGLKTLVTIHKTLGEAGERLNEDEVTIIGAVLELKNKPVGDIMTPMDDVFTMSLDTILDEKMMETILSAGYSRIPIHTPDNPSNFLGMLLVKILITYDPEDAKPVRDFALATLPETAPNTSCLDILNFFQEGKSHMVLVSETPGENKGAVGVVTLEDVIEELIGEEIVDESDVFIDVHKAIRRMHPAPRTRLSRMYGMKETNGTARSRNDSLTESVNQDQARETGLETITETGTRDTSLDSKPKPPHAGIASPKHTTILLRRRSSNTAGEQSTVSKRTDSPEVREYLKHLGPSNLASRPRTTRFTNVKIKPGSTDTRAPPTALPRRASQSMLGGIDAQDGIQALNVGYGTMENRPFSVRDSVQSPMVHIHRTSRGPSPTGSANSASTVHSLLERGENNEGRIGRNRTPRGTTRSGSITENIVEFNGIRKIVLDVSSGSDEAVKEAAEDAAAHGKTLQVDVDGKTHGGEGGEGEAKKKKKRKKRKKKIGTASKEDKGDGEIEPLLAGQE